MRLVTARQLKKCEKCGTGIMVGNHCVQVYEHKQNVFYHENCYKSLTRRDRSI